MRIFAKIMAAPAIAGLKTAGIIIEILAKASCILAGPFLVFVIGCSVYCAVTGSFLNLVILLVVAGACIGLYLLIGALLGAIDIAGAKLKRFLHSQKTH